MEYSRVYGRYYYLRDLGRMNVRNRKLMIENIIPAQLDAISTVARHIVESRIQIMDIDSDYFRRRRRILKVLAKPSISFRRKRRLLLSQHQLIPKLLRTTYLRRTIRAEVRAREE